MLVRMAQHAARRHLRRGDHTSSLTTSAPSHMTGRLGRGPMCSHRAIHQHMDHRQSVWTQHASGFCAAFTLIKVSLLAHHCSLQQIRPPPHIIRYPGPASQSACLGAMPPVPVRPHQVMMHGLACICPSVHIAPPSCTWQPEYCSVDEVMNVRHSQPAHHACMRPEPGETRLSDAPSDTSPFVTSCNRGQAIAVPSEHITPTAAGLPALLAPHQMPTCPTRHAARALCSQIARRPRPPLLPGAHGRQRPAVDVHPRQVPARAHGGGAARAEQHDRVRLQLRERDGEVPLPAMMHDHRALRQHEYGCRGLLARCKTAGSRRP